MSKKDVVINIEPYNSEIRRYEGGFTWTFTAGMGEEGREKKINLKFDRWWLVYLAEDLKTVLQDERNELERLERLCGFSKEESE